jgi:hypothetical protein
LFHAARVGFGRRLEKHFQPFQPFTGLVGLLREQLQKITGTGTKWIGQSHDCRDLTGLAARDPNDKTASH